MDDASDTDSPGIDDNLRKYLLSTITSSIPLDIQESTIAGAGAGVVALKDLPSGSEVFRVKKTFLIGAHDDAGVCDNCFVNPASGINAAGEHSDTEPQLHACKRCHSVRYCSKACQVAAWADHHKTECRDLKILLESKGFDAHSGFRPTTQALSTMFSRLLAKFTNNQLDLEERHAIRNLKSHRHDHLQDSKASALANFMDTPAMHPKFSCQTNLSTEEKLDLYCKILTNSMSVRQPNYEQSLGITLDLFASMINHSCDPNIFFFVEGNQLRFRTTRSVLAGEELFISYTDPTYDAASRSRELKKGYYFSCGCRRCFEEQKDEMDERVLSAREEIQEGLLRSQSQIAYSGISPEAIEMYLRKAVAGHSIELPGQVHLESWPDFFQPMPDMRVFIARLTQNIDTEYSLKMLLKLCFSTFPHMYGGQSGTDWIQAFFLLVFTLRLFIKKAGVSEFANWSLVYMVYLKKLITDAVSCYGVDTVFVEANKKLLRLEKQDLSPEIARSQALIDQFHADQKQVFAWAGISFAKGVQLSYTGDDLL